jgi:hypothetical protein
MMTPRSRCLALVPFLAALACSSPTGSNGVVTARATTLGIDATNHTRRPIFYTAVERNHLALYDYVPCTDETRCETIAPGASRIVPWSQVVFYSPGVKEYVFLWWQASPEGATSLSGSVVVTR